MGEGWVDALARLLGRKMSAIVKFRPGAPTALTKQHSAYRPIDWLTSPLDYGRRCTSLSDQVHRSLEDSSLKHRALDLVTAA